ncbi:hypothetical protein PV326_009821, partial [Microctonus aethiopoides]
MVWFIPLVPAEDIGQAIDVVADAIMLHAKTAELRERSQLFIRYLARYWGRIPDILSVAGSTCRTNNIAEENIAIVIEESERLWRQLTEGGMVMDHSRRVQQLRRDAKLRSYQIALREDRFTMYQFLTAVFPEGEVHVDSTLAGADPPQHLGPGTSESAPLHFTNSEEPGYANPQVLPTTQQPLTSGNE